MKINIAVEKDRKDSKKVVGRVISGQYKGRIAFFKGIVPKEGDHVLAENVTDKGKFIIVNAWKKNPGHSIDTLVEFLTNLSSQNFSAGFMARAKSAVDDRHGLSSVIEIPLEALRIGLEGDKKLLLAYEAYEQSISVAADNGDVVAMSFLALLRKGREIFSSGGQPEEFGSKARAEMLEIFKWVKWSRRNHGLWPTLDSRKAIE